MTNSEYVEEILIKSHSLGIQDEVYELSHKLRKENKTLDFCGSIELAYNQLTK
jgi:hypothetical protein